MKCTELLRVHVEVPYNSVLWFQPILTVLSRIIVGSCYASTYALHFERVIKVLMIEKQLNDVILISVTMPSERSCGTTHSRPKRSRRKLVSALHGATYICLQVVERSGFHLRRSCIWRTAMHISNDFWYSNNLKSGWLSFEKDLLWSRFTYLKVA